MTQFENLNEISLSGGYFRLKNNWDDLQIYQGQFLAWFKAFDTKDPKSPHWYNPYENYSTSREKVNMADVPIYTEKIIALEKRFIQGSVYIALLLAYTSIIFSLSFILFMRYDVR